MISTTTDRLHVRRLRSGRRSIRFRLEDLPVLERALGHENVRGHSITLVGRIALKIDGGQLDVSAGLGSVFLLVRDATRPHLDHARIKGRDARDALRHAIADLRSRGNESPRPSAA